MICWCFSPRFESPNEYALKLTMIPECRIHHYLSRLGAVDEPLASCMIVHFSAHISKWELVCKFGVIFHIFIISCLCSRFHVRNQWFFFYSVITFSYIKSFVHSYTADVVFTLSYWMRSFRAGTFTETDNLLLLWVALFRKSILPRSTVLDILPRLHSFKMTQIDVQKPEIEQTYCTT